ncbi:hypothetical protein PhCBS80983_g04275 [Powellomyces hirtus]|uniref:Serine/threonine-protein kinase RIO1 n=1 Tax=Powellomyces hirtus TaxID=109895 RepID=A0A507DZG7_9FUNG|nr:hypothetical protein PhCBS80983_g04275 [Powellomyces hirtus]
MSATVADYVDGQFSDPESDGEPQQTTDAAVISVDQAQYARLDDAEEEFSEDEEEDDDDLDDDFEDNEFDLNHGDHWFSATGDFTKQYNRLKTQLGVSSTSLGETGKGAGTSSAKSPLQATGMKGQVVAAARSAAKAAKQKKEATMVTTAEAALSEKLIGRIRLDNPSTDSSLNMSRKGAGDRTRDKDKSDRATVEQVLDPRTRIILFKLLNSNIIYEINGCVSTGKEANVYHATTEDGGHRALKIYKTSILTFKDRDRYVSGEYRFRHGYSKSNPRKMVKVWAEKEMRNLKRLHVAGIPCPEPLLLRMHVLLMTFIGDAEGWAAPRLKDAVITNSATYRLIYHQLLKMMWTMYHKCRLVHGDLSEYNLLYQRRVLYIIDVSQSVEHDHPHALEFLRKDCTNVIDYFRKRLPEQIMTVRELFDFVVGDMDVIRQGLGEELDAEEPNNSSETDPDLRLVEKYLEKVHVRIAERPSTYLESGSIQIDEEVFKQLYIPRTLDDVADVEKDVAMLQDGKGDELLYRQVTGLALPPQSTVGPRVKPSVKAGVDEKVGAGTLGGEAEKDRDSQSEIADRKRVAVSLKGREDTPKSEETEEADENEENDDSDGESDEDDSDDEYDERTGKPMKKDEDKDLKKERKKAAKEEKREKRKQKVPKAVKKRKEKVAATRKGGKK